MSIRRLAVGLALFAALSAGCWAPGAATAATVVNGDFEAGGLQGWHVYRAMEAGNWFAYEGTFTPISSRRGSDPVPPPPQGTHAAIADELNPDTVILYQDVKLEPGVGQRLSLLAYYHSYKPIAVPVPDTLSVAAEALEGQHNQQFRIDVMKPGAPLESIDPADILLTVFQTEPGDPAELKPTALSADLTRFGGQTVRLRVAVAAHEEILNAGVDEVSIATGAASLASRFRLGRVKANRRDGSLSVSVYVPGSGLVTTRGIKSKASRKAIKPSSTRASGAGTITVHVKPSAPARRILMHGHRIKASVELEYQPAAGPKEAVAFSTVLRARKRRSNQ